MAYSDVPCSQVQVLVGPPIIQIPTLGLVFFCLMTTNQKKKTNYKKYIYIFIFIA